MAGEQYGSGFELSQMAWLEDFTIDEDQNVYIADGKNHRIVKWLVHENERSQPSLMQLRKLSV